MNVVYKFILISILKQCVAFKRTKKINIEKYLMSQPQIVILMCPVKSKKIVFLTLVTSQ